VRRLHFRRGVESTENCVATPPSEVLISAIDGALTFSASHELLTADQVASVFAMLRISPPVAGDPGVLRDAVEDAAAVFDGRELVSGAELVDRLLDLRLAVRAPREDTRGGGWATIGESPLVHA
jgi:hypothetical protein